MTSVIALTFIVVAAVVLLLVIIGVVLLVSYLGVRKSEAKLNEAWNELERDLVTRADRAALIAEAMRREGGADEREVHDVTEAHERAVAARDARDASAAEAEVQRAMNEIRRVSERHQALQSSRTYLDAQNGFADADSALQAAKRKYNGSVREWNHRRNGLGGKLFARTKPEAEYFEVPADMSMSRPPNVQF